MKRGLSTALLSTCLITLACSQEAATLAVGDHAPQMVVTWVKGTPAKSFESGKLYVVEFWATWCEPCKKCIPHLTQLAKKNRDVDVIGVSVWEDRQSDVVPFVKNMGPKMDYNIAMDRTPPKDSRGSQGKMSLTWMKAAGRNAIPCAFLIDKSGKIAWVGSPDDIDAPLAKLQNGTYTQADYQHARDNQLAEARKASFEDRLNVVVQSGDDNKIYGLLDKMIADKDESIQLEGGSTKLALLLSKNHFDEAYAVAKWLVAGPMRNDSNQLNDLAWSIVDPHTGPDKKDLDIALNASKRSVDLQKNSGHLNTLARVYFLRGDKSKALQTEQEALALAPKDRKDVYEKIVKEYGG